MSDTEKRDVALNPQNMQLAEQWRNDWVIETPDGVTMDDVVKPSFWAHVAHKMRQFDRIDVRAETGEWMAELIVVATGANYLGVHVANFYDFVKIGATREPVKTSDYEIKWGGNAHKFRVIRKLDSAVISSGHITRTDAEVALASHERVVSTT